jgi:peptidoglycan hydrolase-like protein with peptidoglycan-binding domain
MVGADVAAWQETLTGMQHPVKSDGIFGPATKAATVAFQLDRVLQPDGIVGPRTFAAATWSWPARPSFGPITDDTRRRLFGEFTYEPAPSASNPEGIRITGPWPAHNIVITRVPQLAGVLGAAPDGAVMCHRLAAPRLAELFDAWEAAGLRGKVLSWAGMWAPRFVRGSRTTLSNHAWGAAFDINAAWNPLGRQGPPPWVQGSVADLVPIANRLGWFSGSHFADRPDPMHFELARP